ncbi:hypothetical protein LCGC14_1384920 [marine sediment metagenome]|uniref:Uncharacterized protein n=1 Tax=marine sediment metagenome TaxID=412755 RepID=A0A0F9N360_9ZZZZ
MNVNDNFIKVEIELARKMKQNGLVWQPMKHDYYWDESTDKVGQIADINREGKPMMLYIGYKGGFGGWYPLTIKLETSIWLPSIEQSVGTIQELLSDCDYVEVCTTWWTDVCNAYIMYETEEDVIEEEYAGDTQREALYKLLADILIKLGET